MALSDLTHSWWHRQDGRLKLGLFFVYTLTVLLAPVHALAWGAGLAAMLAIALLTAQVPLRLFLPRFGMVLPFIGLSGLGLLLGGAPERFVQVTVKAALCVGASLWLSLTTPFPDLLAALQWLRVPSLLTTLLSFLFRYLFVLAGEAQRMARAYASRCPRRQNWRDAKVVGRLVGALLLRAYDRAERVYQAMLSRGFDGEFRTLRSCVPTLAKVSTSTPIGSDAFVPPLEGSSPDEPPISTSVPSSHRQSVPQGRRPSNAAVRVENLRYRYPDGTQALKGVSFRIMEGESVALVGPNGAGKTTLVLHLNGLLRGEGKVFIFGEEVSPKNLLQVRRQVGLVFQDPDDQLFMPTVLEDVAFGPLNLGLSEEEALKRAWGALELVGMCHAAHCSPHQLSFGERKRVAIATVLAMQPKVLVLDEPTSNLDPRARRTLLTLLKRLPLTKLIVTHDMDAVVHLCQRVIVMDAGEIVAEGPVVTILSDETLMEAHGLEVPATLRQTTQPLSPSA